MARTKRGLQPKEYKLHNFRTSPTRKRERAEGITPPGREARRRRAHPFIITSIILNFSTAFSAWGLPAGITIIPPRASV
jgi:hypothetical protein